MAPIERFVSVSGSFDPETVRLMGSAFDMACSMLERTPNPVMTREAVARGIMDAAKQGERDVERLRDAGLTAARANVSLSIADKQNLDYVI
jgi:hypothetical protein